LLYDFLEIYGSDFFLSILLDSVENDPELFLRFI